MKVSNCSHCGKEVVLHDGHWHCDQCQAAVCVPCIKTSGFIKGSPYNYNTAPIFFCNWCYYGRAPKEEIQCTDCGTKIELIECVCQHCRAPMCGECYYKRHPFDVNDADSIYCSACIIRLLQEEYFENNMVIGRNTCR